MNNRNIIYWTVLIVISTGEFFAIYTQSYNEYFKNEIHHFECSVARENQNVTITLSSTDRTEVCICDSNYYCIEWKVKAKDVNFVAMRSSDSIKISGVKSGSQFSSIIKIDNQPWLQFWEFGICKMLKNGQTGLKFSSIDPNKPDKAATFIAQKMGVSEVTIGNKKEESTLVNIIIKGLPAMMFTAKLWFRKSNNMFIKSEMPKGPFVPVTRVEIQP